RNLRFSRENASGGDCGTGPAILWRGRGSLLSDSKEHFRRARRTDCTCVAGRCAHAIQRTAGESRFAEQGEALRRGQKSLLCVKEVNSFPPCLKSRCPN